MQTQVNWVGCLLGNHGIRQGFVWVRRGYLEMPYGHQIWREEPLNLGVIIYYVQMARTLQKVENTWDAKKKTHAEHIIFMCSNVTDIEHVLNVF